MLGRGQPSTRPPSNRLEQVVLERSEQQVAREDRNEDVGVEDGNLVCGHQLSVVESERFCFADHLVEYLLAIGDHLLAVGAHCGERDSAVNASTASEWIVDRGPRARSLVVVLIGGRVATWR